MTDEMPGHDGGNSGNSLGYAVAFGCLGVALAYLAPNSRQ
jgi:hypothetical protein